jgi:hypothetical protein
MTDPSPPSPPVPDEDSKSLSQDLHERFGRLLRVDTSVEDKLATLDALEPFLTEGADAYISLRGPTQGHLPTLDWKASFRKACVFMMWVRPRLGDELPTAKDKAAPSSSSSSSSPAPVPTTPKNPQDIVKDVDETEDATSAARLLYRISTSADDAEAAGFCVTVGDWKASADLGEVTTMLTAFALPHFKPKAVIASGMATYSSYVRLPLTLRTDAWQLLTFSHTNPYLKRPYWSVSVDGKLVGQGEFTFPSPEEALMEYNALLQNVVVGGAVVQPETAGRPDDQRPASELVKAPPGPTLALELDVASLALYSQPIGASLQALVAEAGPQLSLQKAGRVLATLPPVANWSKGSSLDGPKVGIPLTVHSAALELQRLASSLVFGVAASEVRILGQTGSSQRLVCPMVILPGTTEGTPRVGLLRPGPPLRIPEEEVPIFYLAGHTVLQNAVANYLLASPIGDQVAMASLESSSQYLSVLVQEQGLLTALILPFYLAQCPPGKVVNAHEEWYQQSVQHLYALYSNDGMYAAALIQQLANYLRHGGARVHEEALQSGVLHILASSLRLGLLRCNRVLLFQNPPPSLAALVKRFADLRDEFLPQTRQEGTSPRAVPLAIAEACASLIEACCGPVNDLVEEETPATQMRRSSDLALTALFGLALDYDLWSETPAAAAVVLHTVTERYGGPSLAAGFVMRCQVSVQYFLDAARLRWEGKPSSTPVTAVADGLSRMLFAMLLSSLSNRRSISQGEHDVSACMGALSDSPLGGFGAHVVLNALLGVLAWCEVIPHELARAYSAGSRSKDEVKMQVASRLGRNLLSAQFHDVIAPMLLSRTVFAGDRTVGSREETSFDSDMSWPAHWRLSLLLFSWAASIAGPDGLIASRSSGSLLLAAGVAGSLQGSMEGSSKTLMEALLMPPPAMALMIGSSVRDEWSYSDLLADRLQIMMPLIPGIVASLLPLSPTVHVRPGLLVVLSELLNTVGGTFHRVYGGVIHSTGGDKSSLITKRDGYSEGIKAAKTYVPHFLVIAMLLEKQLDLLKLPSETDSTIEVRRPQTSNDSIRRTDQMSWIDVSSESVISEMTLNVESAEAATDALAVYSILRLCQTSVLNTAAGLLSNAMTLGGSGASVSLWENALSTLRDSVSFAGKDTFMPKDVSEMVESTSEKVESTSEKEPLKNPDFALAQNVLCHLVATVIVKCLKRHYQWAIWSYELSSAMSGLCTLIEDMELLKNPLGSSRTANWFSRDQVLLICSLLGILEYGRDATGWCQLTLPAMSGSSEVRVSVQPDLSAASKLLLPVLQPSFRVLLDCVGKIPSTLLIAKEMTEAQVTAEHMHADSPESLLASAMLEFDSTLTAAVVGLSFYNARDIALGAMAMLRKATTVYKGQMDDTAASLCVALMCKVAEELKERYTAEKRLRETTLLDAYEDSGATSISSRQVAEQSQAVERLLLGGDVSDLKPSVEQVTFENKEDGKAPTAEVSEDFILYHEPGNVPEKDARLGYAQYEGLRGALENCKTESPSDNGEAVLTSLSKYLDAWDEIATKDSEETELVKLFEGSFSIERTNSEGSDASMNRSPLVNIHGSDSAADAMSTYFELAASEKSRLKELSVRFLPSARYSRMSYADRFCWARLSEMEPFDKLASWDRSMPDGNRDVRSRIPTIPVPPQFRRYIPKYLDHGPSTPEASPTGDDAERSDSRGNLRRLTSQEEMDAVTKNLIEAGNLEIVDITKKEVVADDEELEVGIGQPSADLLDDDELFVETGVDPEPRNFSTRDSSGSKDSKGEVDFAEQEASNLVSEDPYEDDLLGLPIGLNGKGAYHHITSSAFATPPDNAASSLSLMQSAAKGMIEMHLDNCLHVKPEGSRSCTMLLTSTNLILEYDGDLDGFYEGELLAVQEEADRQKMIDDVGGSKDAEKGDVHHQTMIRRQKEIAALRPKSIRWNLSELSHAYLRRYRLRDSSIELFFIASGGASFGDFGISPTSSSVFLDFGSGKDGNTRRDDAAFAIMKRAPQQALKQWPDRSEQFLHDQLNRLAIGWVEGRVSNFDYLLHLNLLSGRSFNDICQYPVFPWVLADYTSDEVPDLTDKKSFRDLSKPVGALNPKRMEEFLDRFNSFADPIIPPFMYGSHYSTSAGVVLHFLVRLHPFAGLHRQLQSGHFDVADRLFSSVPRTWAMCTGQSAAEVKEITPEWYCNPAFLANTNKFKLGTSQEGEVIGDVELPPWAKGSPEKFIEVMRAALESEVCSAMLSDWIDLIFGRKQQGPEAVNANNVFFYLTYYGSVDVASIEDDSLRQATELQIAHFGQCPMQLFKRAHVRRLARSYFRLGFYQAIGLYSQKLPTPIEDEATEYKSESRIVHSGLQKVYGEPYVLPFFSAPISHWVHLDAPPPGPHAPLIALRLAGTDRCLAVDARGIFHTFRWAWRAEEAPEGEVLEANDVQQDFGCFIAQRELPRFQSVPRLMYSPAPDEIPAVAISKTLFAGRSVLLVLSPGDARGSLGMQLVDPARGQVRAEATVLAVHSAKITCIATEPIGTAAGQGGVGGELALVGSADGNASLWRFMSSHYLPLRPRVRLSGHGGDPLFATALCSTLHVGVTLSKRRCCIHTLTNGGLIRSFGPPTRVIDLPETVQGTTEFAKTSALAVSVQGYIVTVCQSSFASGAGSMRTVTTLLLFNIEGVLLGSKPLEGWRGVPFKIQCTPDGTAALVCTGRGVTVHRLSALEPLDFVDEFQVTEEDDLTETTACLDLDVGPSLHRPVCAAAACSSGALRLHALPGISAWSERNKKSGLSQQMGSALASPARRVGRAVRKGLGFGNKIADMGRDIGKEVKADVKEKGMSGFLRSTIFGSKS